MMIQFRNSLLIISFLFGVLMAIIQGEVHPFNVQDLIRLKRVSNPKVSPNGLHVVYSLKTYDTETDKSERALHLVSLENTTSTATTSIELTISASEAAWLNDETILFLANANSSSDKSTPRRTGTISVDSTAANATTSLEPITQIWQLNVKEKHKIQLTNFEISVENLKIHRPSGRIAFTSVLPGLPKEEELKYSTGVVYDHLFVRHWDKYLDHSKKSQLFVGKFEIGPDGQVSISQVLNVLKGTDFETPVEPFGDASHFDFSPEGDEIAFTSRIPLKSSEAAWSTNLDIFVVPTLADSLPIGVSTENKGQDSNPVYSPDGKYLAWLQMRTPAYESDRSQVALLNRKSGKIHHLTADWDRSVSSFCWSNDSEFLYVTAEEHGHVKLFRIHVHYGKVKEIISDNSQSSLTYFQHPKEGDSLLMSRNTPMAAPEVYTMALPTSTLTQRSFENQEAYRHILMSDPEAFWFKGAHKEDVMGWIYKPTSFNAQNKYPVAFLIHGGPEGAWNADFGFRWNPQIYAGAGYVAIAINFHGSTGYGSKFTRSILHNWGGAPFKDLMKGLDYALEQYPFLDSKRVCGLGASYGGYMINWINGQTNRFSCLVNHDGIFDTRAAYYATEELWFPEAEFNGPPHSHHKTYYEKWSPALRAHKWQTPTLIIHGEKDYRLPVTEGLSTFTALQRRGIPSRMLYFPNENHWILHPANLVQWYKEIFGWLKHWTSDDRKVRNYLDSRQPLKYEFPLEDDDNNEDTFEFNKERNLVEENRNGIVNQMKETHSFTFQVQKH